MRISRVQTSSFAICSEVEDAADKKAAANPRLRIHKRYLPVGRFEAVKTKGVSHGVVFKKKSTRIRKSLLYVDLTDATLYYAGSGGLLGKAAKLEKSDIFRKLVDYGPQVLGTLNYILEHGSARYSGLDEAAVKELIRRGFVSVFEPKDSQFMNLLRIAADEGMIQKHYVKANFYLPKHDDPRYDLSTQLEVADTVDEAYTIEPIRFSIKKLEDALGCLFNSEIQLAEITYMPHIIFLHSGSAGDEAASVTPVCRKNAGRPKRNYKGEQKLGPITLGTELYEGYSVPVEKATVSFADLGGLAKAKGEIMEAIIYPLLKPELSKKFGKKSGGGILLYGPPGCGKTQLARAAVTECGVAFFNVNVSDIMSQGGDEAKRLHEVFERAVGSAPAIIFFDELDALCSRKASADESKKKVLNQFLTDMSGVERMSEGVLVIAATNVPWELDPALRRAGRFSKQIYIPPPDAASRKQIFEIFLKDRPLSSDIDLARLAESTEGYSGADIEELCSMAAAIPWKDALAGGAERDIDMADFLSAMSEHKPSLFAWSLAAEDVIKKSGEEAIYPELLVTAQRLNAAFGAGGGKQQKPELKDVLEKKLAELDAKEAAILSEEKSDLEERRKVLLGMHDGESADEAFSQTLAGYDSRLNEIERRLKEITKK